jgi:hypothetical protein
MATDFALMQTGNLGFVFKHNDNPRIPNNSSAGLRQVLPPCPRLSTNITTSIFHDGNRKAIEQQKYETNKRVNVPRTKEQ